MNVRLPVAIVTAALVALPALAAHAAEPAAQLNAQIERVFESLKHSDTPAPERQAEVRRIAFEIFDFTETARRALGRYWADRSDDERGRFVRAFTALIDHAYLRRVDHYDGERVVMLGDAVEGDRAIVRTRIVSRDGSEIGVDYAMLREGDRWRVWDVAIAGMSLVSNYRAQFNKILQASSWDEMLRRLEAKSTPP